MGGVGRGSALALLSALLTATGHVLGGGALPDLALLVVLLPLLCGVLVTVADRATGLPGLLTTLAAGQFALHHLLELLHPAHTDVHVMWAVHAGATLVVAVAVRHADDALATVHAALRRVLPRRTAPRPARRPLPVPVPAAPATGLRLAGALAATDVRRGPPEGCRPHPHPTPRRPPRCPHVRPSVPDGSRRAPSPSSPRRAPSCASPRRPRPRTSPPGPGRPGPPGPARQAPSRCG